MCIEIRGGIGFVNKQNVFTKNNQPAGEDCRSDQMRISFGLSLLTKKNSVNLVKVPVKKKLNNSANALI
jgi:hypothetical protein